MGSLYPVEESGDINMEAEPEIPAHEGGAWNLQLFRLVIYTIASARNYRPCFRENKPKALVLYD